MSKIKIIKDCIYGHIVVPFLCNKFMDVPEFQRLRRIRQLGMAHYVYPSATHTRFEHSLGVMYMTGRMVDQLRNFVEISDRKKELIQLGGLYHDIGHFAYSHLFDKFLKNIKIEENVDAIFKLKDHEERSVFFLKQVNNRLKLLTEEEVVFVENVIMGNIPEGTNEAYLYEIVCNAKCGLDMDRVDYINRDSMHTGLPGFQSDYIILNTVINENKRLSFKEKARRDIYDMYESRHRMYQNVYQHHTSLKMDKIYYCMLKRLALDNGEIFKYGKNTDDFNIETILRESDKTKELIEQIDNRNLIHECENCCDFLCSGRYKPSGSIDDVNFYC